MYRTMKSAVLVTGLVVAAVFGTSGVASAATTLTASMSGGKEIPKGDPDGRGAGKVTLNAAKGKVCYDIDLSKVGTVVAGHIHTGKSGKVGAPVVTLFDKPTKQPKGCVSGVSKSVIRSIESKPGSFYLNVHNAKYMAGAVRGQLKG